MSGLASSLFAFFASLGAWGLVLLGIFDSSFLFLPLGNDLLMLGLTSRQPHRLPLYAAMATLGSLLGCALTDWVARKGGEQGLSHLLPPRRLAFVKRRVEKNAGWALAGGAFLPPPFPFTPFVAGAAAFGYPRRKMYPILAVMRLARFVVIGLLAIYFGQRVLALAQRPAVHYTLLGLVVVAVVGSVWSVYGWVKRSRSARRGAS